MLSPFVPHITHVLWQSLGKTAAVVDADWPVVDDNALVQESLELVVQVNGKLRGKIQVPVDADQASIEAAARTDENVIRNLEGKTVRKVIVVPGRLVNIVAN